MWKLPFPVLTKVGNTYFPISIPIVAKTERPITRCCLGVFDLYIVQFTALEVNPSSRVILFKKNVKKFVERLPFVVLSLLLISLLRYSIISSLDYKATVNKISHNEDNLFDHILRCEWTAFVPLSNLTRGVLVIWCARVA